MPWGHAASVHAVNPFPERTNVFIYVCVCTYISLTVPLCPAFLMLLLPNLETYRPKDYRALTMACKLSLCENDGFRKVMA